MVTVLSAVLAAPLIVAAIRKLGHSDDVVRSYARVGVPEDKLDVLALTLLAGAAGLIAGLFWDPIGIAAALGLVLYFVLAVAAHIRFHDWQRLPTPLVILALAAAVLIMRVG
jgi:DoxX-like family